MDPSQVDLKSISEEARYAIFEHLWGRGVRSRELGYSPTVLNKVKNRKLTVSIPMIVKMLHHLSLEEFAKLVANERPDRKPSLSEPRDLSEAVLQFRSSVKALSEAVKRSPQISLLVYQEVTDLVKASLKGYSVQVTEGHVAKFEKLLKDRSPKTVKDHLNYFRRALKDLSYELSADRLQKYILELREDSVKAARHASKALKLFIKLVLKDPNLYQAFKIVKVEAPAKEIPSLEEVKAVAKAIEWPPPMDYYCLLAEAGLRPGEVLGARLNDLNLKGRALRLGKITSTKRSYQAFFSEGLKRYLAETYLPYRGAFVRRYEVSVRNLMREASEGWRGLLFPFTIPLQGFDHAGLDIRRHGQGAQEALRALRHEGLPSHLHAPKRRAGPCDGHLARPGAAKGVPSPSPALPSFQPRGSEARVRPSEAERPRVRAHEAF